MPDLTPYTVTVLTAALALVGWLAREMWQSKWGHASTHIANQGEGVEDVKTQLDVLTKELRSLEDEIQQTIEEEREARIEAVQAVRQYADGEFVRLGEFQQLRTHIDNRFDMMSDRLGDMNENIRATHNLIQRQI